MADNKVFSPKKLAKGFVNANMKFWGGDKIPYLSNSVSFLFDVKGSIDKFKIEPTEKQKIKQYYNTIDRESKNVSMARTKLNTLTSAFEELLTKAVGIKSTVSLVSQNGVTFTSSAQYTVTENLLKRLGIETSSIPETFYRLDSKAMIDPNLKRSYEQALATLKKIDVDVVILLNKLNSHSNQLKSAKKQLKMIVDTAEKKKKK